MSRTFVTAFTFVVALPAAAFDLTDTQGRSHRLADYQGRWVVVNFWATWCVPCIQEIPEIAAFARDHPRVVVIGVAMDAENEAKVKTVRQEDRARLSARAIRREGREAAGRSPRAAHHAHLRSEREGDLRPRRAHQPQVARGNHELEAAREA